MSTPAPGDRFDDLELQVEVWLADEEIELRRLLALEPGRTLSLTRDPEEPVDLVVNGSVVASGELIVVDGRFGFRVGTTASETLAELDASAAAAADEADGAGEASADAEAPPSDAETDAPADDGGA